MISMRQLKLKTGLSDGLIKKLLVDITDNTHPTKWHEKAAMKIINDYLNQPTQPPAAHDSLSGCAQRLGLHKRYLFLAAKEYGLTPAGYYRSACGMKAYYSVNAAKLVLKRMDINAISVRMNYPTPFGQFTKQMRAQMAVINAAFKVAHGH